MEDILTQIPQPPEGAVFTLQKVEKVSLPHPFCITPKHVEIAADRFGGMLGKAAIEEAERRGHHCGMRGCRLSFRDHETQQTLFIQVPQNRDLNAVPGLHSYLVSIKDRAVELGIQGFAFPK